MSVILLPIYPDCKKTSGYYMMRLNCSLDMLQKALRDKGPSIHLSTHLLIKTRIVFTSSDNNAFTLMVTAIQNSTEIKFYKNITTKAWQ